MKRLVLTLHLAVALVFAAFILILGVTGSVMAFEEELDHAFNPRLFRVAPGPHALTLANLAASASRTFPGERVAAFGMSVHPDLSYNVAFRSGTVFVNQYTGEALGLRSGQTLLGKVHQLHLRLLDRTRADYGKKAMSWAGVAILFLSLSGLYLWWPLKRVTIKWGAASHRVWFDLHNLVGIGSLVFLVILSLTGVMIGFEQQTVPLFYKMTGSEPLPTSFTITPVEGATPVTPDQAVEIARAALPGAVPISVNVPGPKNSYRVAARYPEDLTPGGRSRIYIDQYTGKVLQAESSRTTAAGTRMVILNRAIHTGDIFGLPSKIVMSLASLALALQAVSGVLYWWKKKKT